LWIDTFHELITFLALVMARVEEDTGAYREQRKYRALDLPCMKSSRFVTNQSDSNFRNTIKTSGLLQHESQNRNQSEFDDRNAHLDVATITSW
jgi:hypothetical protein